MEFMDAEGGCIGGSCRPDIPVCEDSNDVMFLVNDGKVPDSFVPDEGPGFIKTGIRMDG